ncbi:MAG TPA: aminopeptidase P family protein [Bacteroidia bacterium]|jgi:Xaa-Pro aminopeptidase|nr:aminopeptidase P family protein [Bacteroidia bacterium]
MKYTPINSNLFIENRKRFAASLKPNSIALFVSNDILPSNADGALGFVQNSDLFYLSGVDQEETILLIYPDATNGSHKEILFVRETSELIAIWEGAKLTKEQATKTSGIKNIQWVQHFEQIIKSVIFQADRIYLNSNEHTRQHIHTETAEMRFNKKIKEQFPLHTIERSAPIMHSLRAIKSDIEIELIQKACDITEKGFRRLLGFIKPGVMEYEIEAELIHEFIRNRSNGFAYGPIIASGHNACVLHYVENNKECKDGDVILLDVAAEYANYRSDLTRCLPVNGKFSPRQKDVYNAVLRVMRAATKMLVVGNTFTEYNKAVGQLMEKELVDLGLLTKDDIKKQNPELPAYKKYFMHGTSHFLGLDVHDVGDFNRKMEAGMVFTCEPGIYIPDENLGIRIENNIWVTSKGPVDLMKNIPVEVDEIESLMAKKAFASSN